MVKNETRLDLDYNLRVTENMAGRKCRIMLIVAAAILIVCGGVVISLDYLLPDGEPDLFFPIVCFAIGALFLIFALLFKAFMRFLLKRNMQGKISTNTYTFTEEGYEVITDLNDGTESSASGNYISFTEVREYKDMWLLYLNKATVFSVSKDGMTQGSAEDLSALLISALGNRYKLRCRK